MPRTRDRAFRPLSAACIFVAAWLSRRFCDASLRPRRPRSAACSFNAAAFSSPGVAVQVDPIESKLLNHEITF
jgi:hypothetical protein